MKQKANNYKSVNMLKEIHDKAKRTLEVLTKNMIAGEIPLDRIFDISAEVNRTNIIKLLLRCRKMYEARVDVKNILLLLTTKDVTIS